MREIFRKLRGGLVLSTLWGAGIGVVSFAIVLLGHLIRGSGPTTQDLIGIPGFLATGGFILGMFFSLALVLGVRDGQLSRLKAGLLGFASGPVVMALLNLSRGTDLTRGLLLGSIMMGLLIGLLGALTLGVAAADEGADDGGGIGEPTPDKTSRRPHVQGPGVDEALDLRRRESVSPG